MMHPTRRVAQLVPLLLLLFLLLLSSPCCVDATVPPPPPPPARLVFNASHLPPATIGIDPSVESLTIDTVNSTSAATSNQTLRIEIRNWTSTASTTISISLISVTISDITVISTSTVPPACAVSTPTTTRGLQLSVSQGRGFRLSLVGLVLCNSSSIAIDSVVDVSVTMSALAADGNSSVLFSRMQSATLALVMPLTLSRSSSLTLVDSQSVSVSLEAALSGGNNALSLSGNSSMVVASSTLRSQLPVFSGISGNVSRWQSSGSATLVAATLTSNSSLRIESNTCATAPCSVRLMLLSLSCSSSPLCVVLRSNILDARGAASQAALFNLVYAAMTLEVATTMVASGGSSVSVTSNTLSSDYRAQYVSVGSSVALSGGSSLLCSGNTVVGYMTSQVASSSTGVGNVVLDVALGTVTVSTASMLSVELNSVSTIAQTTNAVGDWTALLRVSMSSPQFSDRSFISVASNVITMGKPLDSVSSVCSCTDLVSVLINGAVLIASSSPSGSVVITANQIASLLGGTVARSGLMVEHTGAVRVSGVNATMRVSNNVVHLLRVGVAGGGGGSSMVVGWLFDSTLAVDSSGMLQMIGNSATVDTKSGASSIALGPTTMHGVAVVVYGTTSVASGAVVSVSQNRVSMASGSSVSSGVFVSVNGAQTSVQSDGALVVDENTVSTPQGLCCGPSLTSGGSLDGFCGGVVLSHASLLLQSNGTLSLSSNTVSMVGSISGSPSSGACVMSLGTMLGGVVVMGTRNVVGSGSFVASGGSTLLVQLNIVSLQGTDFNVLGIASFVWSTLSAQGGSSLIFEANQVTCSMTTTLANSNVIVGGVLVPTASTIQTFLGVVIRVARNSVTLSYATASGAATVNGYAIGWHGQLSVGDTSSLSLSMNTVAISAVSIGSGSQITVVGLSVRSTTTATGGGGSLRIVDASQVSVDGNILSCPSTAAGAGAVIGIWLELGSENACTVSAPASLAVVNSSILSFSFNTIQGTAEIWYGGVLRATGGPSCTAVALWRSSRLIAQANVVSSPVTGSALYLEFVASFSSPLSAAVTAASGDSSSSSFMDAACVVVSRGSTISIRENVASAYVGLSGIEVYIQTTYTAAMTTNAPTSFVVSDQSQVSIDRNRIQSTGSHGVFLNLNFASSGGYSAAAVTGYVLNNRATVSLSSNVIGSSVGAGLRIFLSPASSCYDYVYDCSYCQQDGNCNGQGSSSSCTSTVWYTDTYSVNGTNYTTNHYCSWVSASCTATHCDFPATRVLHLLQSSLIVTSNDVTTAVSLRPAFLFDRSSGEMLSLTWSGGSSFRLSQNAFRVTGGTTSSVFAMAVVDLFRCVVGVSGGSLCERSTDTQPHVGSVMGVEASVVFAGQSSMYVESNAFVGYSVAWMWTTSSAALQDSTAFFFTSNTVQFAVGPPIVQGVPSNSLIGFFVNGTLGLSSTVSSSCPIRFHHNRFFTQGTSVSLVIFKVALTSTVSSGIVSSFRCDSVNGAVASGNRYSSWLGIVGVPTTRLGLSDCTSRSLSRSREVTVTVLNSVSARVSSSRTRVNTKTRSSSRSEFHRPHTRSRTLQAETKTVGITVSALQIPGSVSRAFLSGSCSQVVTRASPLVSGTLSSSPSPTSSRSLTIRSISLRRNATASAGMSGSLRTPTATASVTKGCPIRISELESVSPLWEAPPPLTISAAAADVTLSAPEVLVNGATLRARSPQSAALLEILQAHFRIAAAAGTSTELPVSSWSAGIALYRVRTSSTSAPTDGNNEAVPLGAGNITAVADSMGSVGFHSEVVVNVHRQREFTVVDGDILVAWINISALLPADDAWCAGSVAVPAFRLIVGTPLSSVQISLRNAVTAGSTISMVFQLATGDGGNDLQSMILVGMMACTPRGSLQNGFGDLRALAPLLMEATFDGVIWSNLLLLGVVLMLQCVVMGVLAIVRLVHSKRENNSIAENDDVDDEFASDATAVGKLENNSSKRRGSSDRPAAVEASTASVAQMARFPGVFISAVVFIYQGTLFAAIRLMQQNANVEGGGALLAVGVVFTVVLYPLPLAVGLLANRIHRSYHTYLVKLGRTADVFTWQYRGFAALPALEATGVMLPKGLSGTWGPLVAASLPHPVWTAMPLAGGWLMCTAALLQFYHERAYCTSIFVLLALCNFVLCGATLYYRPRRSTMINIIAAVQLAVCGVTLLVCAASAYDAKYGGGDTVMALLGFSQSGLSMITTVATLCVVFSDELQKRRACIVRLAWQVGELCTAACLEERRLRWYLAMRLNRRRVHRGAAAGVLLPLIDEEDVEEDKKLPQLPLDLDEGFAPFGEAEDVPETGLSALLYLEDALKDRQSGSLDADDVEMGPVMMNHSDASEGITALNFWTDSDGAGGSFGANQSLEEKLRTRTSLRDAALADSALAGRSTLAPTQLLRGSSSLRMGQMLELSDEDIGYEDDECVSGVALPLLSERVVGKGHARQRETSVTAVAQGSKGRSVQRHRRKV